MLHFAELTSAALAVVLGTAPGSEGDAELLHLGEPRPAAIEIDGQEIEPRYFVDQGEAFAPSIFAGLCASQVCEPVVLVRGDDERWWVRALESPEGGTAFRGSDWQYVGQGEPAGTLWAVVDNEVGSYGWELDLLRSTDGGLTWRHSRLSKVSYWAWFEGLRMSADGRGRLSIWLDDDYPGGTPDTKPRGLYHYRTEDFGLTWSEPIHEANDLQPASTNAVEANRWHRGTAFMNAWTSFRDSVPAVLPVPLAGSLETIEWQLDSDGELEIDFVTDFAVGGAVERERLSRPPREVLRLCGAVGPTDPLEWRIPHELVRRIRTGFHQDPRGDRLHIVIDLAAESVRVDEVPGPNATTLRLRIRASPDS